MCAHVKHDSWSSLSSVESLANLTVQTPPPSKGCDGAASAGTGFRRLSARTATNLARPEPAGPYFSERPHRLPLDKDIKAETRFRYAPSDRAVWRPVIEQLSQRINDQQHELWEVQHKLRDEARHSAELAHTVKAERKEHKEVVAALSAQLGLRHDADARLEAEARYDAEARVEAEKKHRAEERRRGEPAADDAAASALSAARNESERAWKRCAELETLKRAAEEDATRQAAGSDAELAEMQAQIAKLTVAASQASQASSEPLAAELKAENEGLKAEIAGLQSAASSSTRHAETLAATIEALRAEMHTLAARIDTLQTDNSALRSELGAKPQLFAAELQQREDDIWKQASELAAKHISLASKQAEAELASLNERLNAQAATIASQKEVMAMAHSQMEFMRTLLGDSIGKILDQRLATQMQSARSASLDVSEALRPSPVNSPEPWATSKTASPGALPKAHRTHSAPNTHSTSAHAAPGTHSTSAHANSPRTARGPSTRKQPPQQLWPEDHEPEALAHEATGLPFEGISEQDEMSTDSLSTVQEGEDLGKPYFDAPTKNPLFQSTVNHSSTLSSTSTPNSSLRQTSRPAYAGSVFDEFYKQLASGKISSEELGYLESIYEARNQILAERPTLELDVKNMLAGARSSGAPEHAPIISRMMKELS